MPGFADSPKSLLVARGAGNRFGAVEEKVVAA